MAVHIEQQQEIKGGFSKGIDSGAMNLILENLQKFQYQFPIKSTIREIACNGVDSIADKNAAIDILVNNAPISKYFEEEIEGDLYRDSKFDPSYYDPKWLSSDDMVYITYIAGAGMEKDYLTIEDFGVGLGRTRLEKFFSLGFSTKRLSKQPLGKFGIGAKSPLSVGVDFYTVESRYNGELYRFNVYSNTVESIIPKFNLEDGTINDHVVFGTAEKPYIVYYEPTLDPNGVTVTVAAKKHHKDQYQDAVKSQLLYFDNIVFQVVTESGTNLVDHKATILYEDDDIILSDNSMWAKPHLLLNKVNYGYINWDELELENKRGNIGIKVDPSQVDINPSRESVLWSDRTKEVILGQYKKVVGVATRLVQKELQEPDYIKWLRTCHSISSGRHSNMNTVVSKLADIVDMAQISPAFPGEPKLKFRKSDAMPGFNLRHYHLKHNRQKVKVVRDVIDSSSIGALIYLPFVLIDEATSVRRDRYLLTHTYPDGFIGVKKLDWVDTKPEDEVQGDLFRGLGLDNTPKGEAKFDTWRDTAKLSEHWMMESESKIMYSSVIVPDSFSCSEKEEDEDEETEEDKEEAQVALISNEARRKLEGKTIYHTLSATSEWKRHYQWVAREVPISNINGWDRNDHYYGNDADSEALFLANFIAGNNLDDKQPYAYTIYQHSDMPLIFRVAISANKLYRDFKHIRRFFMDVKNNVISMSNKLIGWNTARLMVAGMPALNFMFNFDAIDPNVAEVYKEVDAYIHANYSNLADNYRQYAVTEDAHTGLVSHLDKVQAFQEYVASNAPAEQIAEMAKELFGNDQLTDGRAVDMTIYNKYLELRDYAMSVEVMLNQMPLLTGRDDCSRYEPGMPREASPICEEVEQAIKGYMSSKGLI